MEEFGSTRFNGIGNPVRKKRTQTSRRPRPESQPLAEGHDNSPLSSTPPSDDASKFSSDENGSGDTNSRRKEFNLNQCVSRVPSGGGAESENFYEKNNKRDGEFNAFYNNEPGRSGFNNRRSSEGVLAPANWKNTSKLKGGFDSESSVDTLGGRNCENQSSGKAGVVTDGSTNENKVKMVKLRVGGVTRTIQANSMSSAVGGGYSTNGLQPSDASRVRQKQNLQGNSDHNYPLQGIPWKDFPRGGFSLGKDGPLMGKVSGKITSGKQAEESEPVRKSKRVPKRRVLDGEFGGDDDDDDEIRYLEKLKTSKFNKGSKEDDEESGKKHRKLSGVSNVQNGGSSRSGKDGNRLRLDRASEETDFEEDSGSDGEVEGKKKKQIKEYVDSLGDNKREMTLTTRQRALQSGKDAAPGTSLIEFPNGLPPAPPRKQKEKLTELEQQLKKAEAAQRRRMQVEKAARESEAEAIRKILGQDSSRKKREDKLKKRNEELAQERAANAMTLASNTVRLVMRPTGTVVIFSEDIGLPSIFNSKPCSYPPPRENCAGPSCTNPYKYRDSKSKLPLCSLQCYKAIQEKMLPETTC